MQPDSSAFSEREKDVVQLLLQGKSNKQIALALGIANRTVEFHLSNIYARLGVNSRAEAILKLTGQHLRETTGDFQGISTVAQNSVSTDNGIKPALRRNPVKKLYFLIGGLLVMVLVLGILILNQFSGNRPANPPAPTAPASATNSPATLAPTDAAQPATATAPAQQPTNPPAGPVIPPHTVNGYTAAIESYYVDSTHVIFQVRLSGGTVNFGDPYFYDRFGGTDLHDEHGNLINTSGGWGPALDPALFQFEFVPVTQLKGDRLKGQFLFDLNAAPEYEKILASFRFDFDLPINPDVRFYPKQVVSANGLEILLDSVTVAPNFTQIYVCFPSPSYADWNIGNQTVLQIDGQEAIPYNFSLPFDSALGGSRLPSSEPYWAPPTKNGRCIKSGFRVGSSNPTSLTLTIPRLEKSEPDKLVENQFSKDYPGLSAKQAYYKYIEEQGDIYRGPWTFTVVLKP